MTYLASLATVPVPEPPRHAARALARRDRGLVVRPRAPHVGARDGAPRVAHGKNARRRGFGVRGGRRRPLAIYGHYIKPGVRVHHALQAVCVCRANLVAPQPKRLVGKKRALSRHAPVCAVLHAGDVDAQRRGGRATRLRGGQRDEVGGKGVEGSARPRRRVDFQQAGIVADSEDGPHPVGDQAAAPGQAAAPQERGVKVRGVVKTVARRTRGAQLCARPRRLLAKLHVADLRPAAAVPGQAVEKLIAVGAAPARRAFVQRHARVVLDEQGLFQYRGVRRGVLRRVEVPAEHPRPLQSGVLLRRHAQHGKGCAREIVFAVQGHPVANAVERDLGALHEGQRGVVLLLRHGFAVGTPAQHVAGDGAREHVPDGQHKVRHVGVVGARVVPQTVRFRDHVVPTGILLGHVHPREHARLGTRAVARTRGLVVRHARVLHGAPQFTIDPGGA